MRDKLRGARLLIAFPFRVDPLRAGATLLLTIVSQLAAVAVAIAFGLITNAVVDHLAGRAVLGVVLLGLAIAVSSGGGWTTFLFQTGLMDRTTWTVDRELARLCADAVGIEHLERPDYLNRIEYLRQYRLNLVTFPIQLASTFATVLRLGVTLVLLAEVKPILALLPLFGIPAMFAVWNKNRRLSKLWDDEVGPLWRRQGAIRRLAGTERGGREIRVFGLQEEVKGRYDQLLDDADRLWGRVSIRGSAQVVAGWTFFGCALAFALSYMAHLAVAGHLSPGGLVLVITLATQMNSHLGSFAGTLSSMGSSLRTADRLAWLMEYSVQDAKERRQGSASAPLVLSEGIRFENVTFRYPETDSVVLQDVNLFLPAGTTVAIVGENGAGKTTFVKLLLRMYEPSEGRILVDGHDLQSLDVDEWRRRAAGGFQDFTKFEFSAQRAVGIGHLDDLDDEAAVVAALNRAEGASVLEDLSGGLTTQLGRNFADGVELSAGQWQKIALGRAMMRAEPVLLVLDEPTASLDAVAEAALFERFAGAALRTSGGSRGITLMVSHRFSTVRMADLIVVIKNGSVVEFGSHGDLIAVGGTYSELYELQARSYR